VSRARVALGSLLMLACASGHTVTLASGTLEEHVSARARVEPTRGVARVAAPWTARVLTASVEAGDTVSVGAELAQLDRGELEPFVLVAPIAGVVVARHASVGDDVSRADGALFEIADPSALRLRIEIEDADAARVAVGETLTVRASGETLAHARVERLAPRMEPRAIDPDGQLVRVAFATLDPGPAFPLDRVLDVSIALPLREVAVCAPREAVAIRDGRTVVRGADGSGVVVRLGALDETHVEIVDGIVAGAVVRVGD
jgi:multidrug efflux pump subunit AcrA (membrane-fusion protein)